MQCVDVGLEDSKTGSYIDIMKRDADEDEEDGSSRRRMNGTNAKLLVPFKLYLTVIAHDASIDFE